MTNVNTRGVATDLANGAGGGEALSGKPRWSVPTACWISWDDVFFSWFSRYVLKDNIGYDIYMIYNMYMIYYIYVSDQVNMKFIF